MLILALDTGTPEGSVAVVRDGFLAGVVSTSVTEDYSTRLFRQLEFLCEELHLEMRQFDLFAIAAGPGSFTGLRVGLAAVKAWAEVFDKPIVALSGLEAVAAQTTAHDEMLVSVMDARRGQVYAALFRSEGKLLIREGEEQVCAAAEFLAALPGRLGNKRARFVSPNPDVIQSSLAADTLPATILRTVERVSSVLAPVIGELAFERAKRGEVTDALRLDANYIRRSDAEVLWKGP